MPALWIAFNGHWPERGAMLETGTFKELEALTVAGRLPDDPGCLVVASAGNTAAAFAMVCSRYDISVLLLVPDVGLRFLRLRRKLAPCVRLVIVKHAEYADCIDLAARVSQLPGFNAEGGVMNVGRRDGLGTVLLAAYEAMRRLPEYYFQAVGSGAGAIAVHEAARRLLAAGEYGPALPRLMLAQNAEFAPMYDAWRSVRSIRLPEGGPPPALSLRRAHAPELTNRRPPFSVGGGVRDCLTESNGDVLVADRRSAKAAMKIFHKLEGIDIEPASAVAVACLQQSVAARQVPRDATVLLNITGGGRLRLAQDYPLVKVEPTLWMKRRDLESTQSLELLTSLFPVLSQTS
jgi:cysteate synthase